MTQHYLSNGNRPSSSSDNTLPPIRSVFPPHILSSSGYTTIDQQRLVAACPDDRLQRALTAQTGHAGRGALSIRTAPSLSSSTAVQYAGSSASSTASPTVSESGSQLYTSLSSHTSSPETTTRTLVHRGSQDSQSLGLSRKRGSSDDDHCDGSPCTTDMKCKRHRKIANEKGSRGKQQEVHENAEDFMEIRLDWRAPKAQATGNRAKSGLDRDKQQNYDALYIFGETLTEFVLRNNPDKFASVRLMAIDRINKHAQRDPRDTGLPEGSPMAGPNGLADFCTNANASGECPCADRILCRKECRRRGAQMTDEQRTRDSHTAILPDRTAPSLRTPRASSSRTPTSSSTGSRQKGKL
ncbi:hypothetical protein B0A48_11103 [Cryoendolithus antarcticus]|uniref:Uncharacterized protein n=1 Tax=Cryoendolithus antarcticus TaxID=1507870 RepID=A0A1V8SUU4_9PEZI|nr:hypothetical protein B0A48_11103 [Cryoendolithus antarcticus]